MSIYVAGLEAKAEGVLESMGLTPPVHFLGF